MGKVIRHPSAEVALLEAQRDLLADVLLDVLAAFRDEAPRGSVGRVLARARTALRSSGFEVPS